MLWLAATVVAGAAAWGAVRLAGDETAEQAVRPMSASEVAALATSTSLAVTTTSNPPTSDSSTLPTTTSTSAPAGVTSTIPAATAARQTRGGTVVVSLEGERVSLVSATPAPGYAVEIEEAGPGEVRVSFEGPAGEVQVRAAASGGQVVWEVEEGDDGG